MVSKKVDWSVSIVLSENWGFSGTSGKHWAIHECISAKLNGPFKFRTLKGLKVEKLYV